MKNKAFTLIELLVVIAVLGLLSAIVLVSLRGQNRRAEYANLLQYDAQIKHALGAYILGEWTFDNDTLVDTSGNNYTAVMGSGGANYVDNEVSELGRAFDVVGANRFDIANFSIKNSEKLTASFWINTGEGDWSGFYMDDGTNVFYVTRIGNGLAGGIPLPGPDLEKNCSLPASFFQLGEWHHIVLTYDGAAIAIYVDGEISCSEAGSGSTTISDSTLMIGDDGIVASVDGEMDSVRIYGESLDITQVQKLYVQEKVEFID